jgi:hypothetical protein
MTPDAVTTPVPDDVDAETSTAPLDATPTPVAVAAPVIGPVVDVKNRVNNMS